MKQNLIDMDWGNFDDFAEMIVKSKAYTYHQDGKEKLNHDDIVLKLMKGYELGLGLFESLTALYNEHGRLTINVDAMMGLILNSGLLEHYEESRTKTKCVIKVKRKGVSGAIQTFTYTIDDAEDMGLTKGSGAFNYKKQPDVMLYKRCASKMARTLFRDVITGVYVEGEYTDGTVDEEDYDDAPIEKEIVEDVVEDQDAIEEAIIEEEDEYEENDLEEDDLDEEDEDEDDYTGDNDDFDPVEEMIAEYNLDCTPEQYEILMRQFGEWCLSNLDVPSDEDFEQFVIDLLRSLNFPIFEYIEEDEDGEETEFEMIPCSTKLLEEYKKAIETHLSINKVGFDDDEEAEQPELDDSLIDEIEDDLEEEELDEGGDEEPEDEDDEEEEIEELSWDNFDDDEWEDEE